MMKNGFLTLFFAFIPGAGQMYQGYMKRGLSLATFFCLGLAAGSLINILALSCGIVWMYSFFDALNLRAQIGAETAPADDYLLHLDRYDSKMALLASESHKLFGWTLILLGVLVGYEYILMRIIDDLLWNSSSPVLRTVYLVCDELPQVLVCVVFIVCGVWLVRGPRGAQKEPKEKKNLLEEFRAYRAAKQQPAEPAPEEADVPELSMEDIEHGEDDGADTGADGQ